MPASFLIMAEARLKFVLVQLSLGCVPSLRPTVKQEEGLLLSSMKKVVWKFPI